MPSNIPSLFYRWLPLQPLPPLSPGFFISVLDSIHACFNTMENRHNAIFIMRISILIPSWAPRKKPEFNDVFHKILTEFIEKLYAQGLDPRFVWTRDAPDTPLQPFPIRYQLLLVTDGTIPQSSNSHIAMFSGLLAKVTNVWGANTLVAPRPILHQGLPITEGIVLSSRSVEFPIEVAETFMSVSEIAMRKKAWRLHLGCLEFGQSAHPGWTPTLRALI